MFFCSCHVVCSVLFVVCNLCLFTWLARVSSIRLNIQLADIWCLYIWFSHCILWKDTNGTHGLLCILCYVKCICLHGVMYNREWFQLILLIFLVSHHLESTHQNVDKTNHRILVLELCFNCNRKIAFSSHMNKDIEQGTPPISSIGNSEKSKWFSVFSSYSCLIFNASFWIAFIALCDCLYAHYICKNILNLF